MNKDYLIKKLREQVKELKEWRNVSSETKQQLYILTGRIKRRLSKLSL